MKRRRPSEQCCCEVELERGCDGRVDSLAQGKGSGDRDRLLQGGRGQAETPMMMHQDGGLLSLSLLRSGQVKKKVFDAAKIGKEKFSNVEDVHDEEVDD